MQMQGNTLYNFESFFFVEKLKDELTGLPDFSVRVLKRVLQHFRDLYKGVLRLLSVIDIITANLVKVLRCPVNQSQSKKNLLGRA